MTKTYAAVQHGPRQISIDELSNGKYLCQVSFWFNNRAAAKVELDRLSTTDGVPKFREFVIGRERVGLA